MKMNREELFQAAEEIAEQYKDVLEWFESQGKRSWLILSASVYAHKPQRDEKGNPMALFGSYIAEGVPRQSRLCIQSDGFTQLELEILEDETFRVLCNKCMDNHYYEDRAYAGEKFAVGNIVTLQDVKDAFLVYVSSSNDRARGVV